MCQACSIKTKFYLQKLISSFFSLQKIRARLQEMSLYQLGQTAPVNAPIMVQTAESFVAGVMAGDSSLFSIGSSVSGNKGATIHDPTRIIFFSHKNTICGHEIVNAKPFINTFGTVQEMKAFHQNLLSKPFAFNIKLYAEHRSGDIKFREREKLVVTVFPQHPDVTRSFLEELARTEETFKEGGKCSLKISFSIPLYEWYFSSLYQRTGLKWNKWGFPAEPNLLSTNSSAPLRFCGNVGCVLLGIFLCPLFCCSWAAYKTYRCSRFKDKRISFNFKVAFSSHCVV